MPLQTHGWKQWEDEASSYHSAFSNVWKNTCGFGSGVSSKEAEEMRNGLWLTRSRCLEEKDLYGYEFGLTWVVFVMQQKELIQLKCEARLKAESLQDALKQLFFIDAIDANGTITTIRKTMAGAIEEKETKPKAARTKMFWILQS
ncbi:hypothetical protein Tco_0276451 [Tanacetum coccineum]